MSSKTSIAIIGCGMAGVSLARLLVDDRPSVTVTLFDKGRGLGGRMATRYTEDLEFDHGAQFFTVRGQPFEQFLKPYRSSFKEWKPAITTLSPNYKKYNRIWFEPHYVSAPRMNSLCKQIAQGLHVQLQQKILDVSGRPGRWVLESEHSLAGPFDWVISTAPAPQTQDILKVPEFNVTYDPTYALMVPIAKKTSFDAAVVRDSPLSWLAVTASKPGRGHVNQRSIVAHASTAWSAKHLNTSAEEVKAEMLHALNQLSLEGLQDELAALHLWRFARPSTVTDDSYYLDTRKQLAACGDWCRGTNVEDAFQSAYELFLAIRTQIPKPAGNLS
ncbi:MAG: NAD(P)-binding protein [Pseudomonadales bacterium]|nr:NAD(P)-binding protein [Pseudomonadales bacterium]